MDDNWISLSDATKLIEQRLGVSRDQARHLLRFEFLPSGRWCRGEAGEELDNGNFAWCQRFLTPAWFRDAEIDLDTSFLRSRSQQTPVRHLRVTQHSLETWVKKRNHIEAWLGKQAGIPAAPPAEQIADPYKTGLPGKPSIAHLIKQELERRQKDGVVESVLAHEAVALRTWAIEKHPAAPIPTARTIENQIRVPHRHYKSVQK